MTTETRKHVGPNNAVVSYTKIRDNIAVDAVGVTVDHTGMTRHEIYCDGTVEVYSTVGAVELLQGTITDIMEDYYSSEPFILKSPGGATVKVVSALA